MSTTSNTTQSPTRTAGAKAGAEENWAGLEDRVLDDHHPVTGNSGLVAYAGKDEYNKEIKASIARTGSRTVFHIPGELRCFFNLPVAATKISITIETPANFIRIDAYNELGKPAGQGNLKEAGTVSLELTGPARYFEVYTVYNTPYDVAVIRWE